MGLLLPPDNGSGGERVWVVLEWLVLYCYLLIHAEIYIYILDTYRRNDKDAGRLLYKYMCTTHFICKGSKGLYEVSLWEGAGDRTETAIFWPLLLWPSTLCLSRSPDAQPEAQRPTLLGDGFLYCILSATSLVPKLHRLLRPGVAFPTTSRLPPSPTLTGTLLTSVLTELYNSSTPTQSPTRFLESPVGSSSSGNNCHAVHRSLSSGASVYECTMGIFLPRPISSANFRPRDFLS